MNKFQKTPCHLKKSDRLFRLKRPVAFKKRLDICLKMVAGVYQNVTSMRSLSYWTAYTLYVSFHAGRVSTAFSSSVNLPSDT